jgi:hypothetical protein
MAGGYFGESIIDAVGKVLEGVMKEKCIVYRGTWL